MIAIILKAIGFIKNVFKVFKIAKAIITIIELVNTCDGLQNTINMKTKNGVNVSITIAKNETANIIDAKELKEIDEKGIVEAEEIDDADDIDKTGDK